ncbi:hypothetical protein [Motiliproteus sediminis]|uniref:hypothetical protein n=1 Tax=Motiliproteus sediminis TaxID=1468178 RepID=UPI001AEFFAA4|nr:hypothetical protein [Motiliproteus sediminis]
MKSTITIAPLVALALLTGCATNPCSPLYNELTELDRFMQEPGYARQHIRYPLRYTEIKDGEVRLDTELDEAEALQRHAAIQQGRALTQYHQRIAVPIREGDSYVIRAGPAGQPATDIYRFEPGLCEVTLVEYRRYL